MDQTFTVQSTRSGTVSGTVSTSAPFSIVSGSPFTLTGVGATQTVTVRFRPTTFATATTSVNLTADGDTISRIVTGIVTDTAPPTVAMTSPTSDPTYSPSSSTLTLGGTASDDVGVTQVTWANSRGGSGTAAGTTSWTASGIVLQPGTNVLTVTARDAAGNTATASLTVTFSDTTPPTISVTAPAAGATVGASTTVVAVAADNVGVVGVQFTLDGVNLGAERTTPPYTIVWDTTTVANGTHILTAVARDAAGHVAAADGVAVRVSNDTAAPSVAIAAPAAGAVAGSVSVVATAADDVGVAGVQLKLDGANLGAERTTPPYTILWDTTTAANGAHTLTAVARDAAGNVTTSADVTVTISNDVTAPSVVITAPAAGASVAGSVVVVATAADDRGVAGVQFKLDGVNLGAERTAPPYTIAWDTITTANGAHTLAAVVRDAAGNVTTSAGVTVTVSNDVTGPSVAITAPVAGASVARGVAVVATATDDRGVAGVQFKLDGVNLGAEQTTPPYTMVWDTTTVANGTHILTAVARDAAGHVTAADGVAVRVDNDITAPSVAITAPAAGAVAGSISVVATAADDRGVAGVQFKLDGVNHGAERTTPPYSIVWDTTAAANGTHSLTAVARDAAGNVATSAGVTVTVSNDVTAPGVAITAPAAGAVTGRVSIVANAADDRGVAGVQFKLDGVNLGAEDTTNTYSVTWDTTSLANGTYTLTAVARDAAGNLSTSAAVTVIVANDRTSPVLSAIGVGAITVSGATLVWTTDESSTSQVEYGATTAYGSASAVDGSLVTVHVVLLNGLAPNTPYHFRVRSRDAVGNLAISGDFTFTTLDGDLTAPAVIITAPSPGSAVARRVAVAVNATDNVGVAGVQFQLDGAALGAEVRAAPYALDWDTTTVADGTHTLTAVARDAAGNVATSPAVTITVANRVQVSLAPQDTYINLNATNYSTSPWLSTYTWPDNRVANAILMKFDLSSIPAGAVVQEATLHLALVESDKAPEGTYTVTAHKMVGTNPDIAGATGYTADGVASWTPNACCYSNAPLAQADISPAYARQAIDKTPGYKAWAITAMVREWLAAPATNFGLLLNSDPSQLMDRYRYFASMEHPDGAIRPFLRITYTFPPTSRVSLAPQDTYINVDATNYSTSPWLSTYTWPDNRVANAILMKFDLSSIPAGAVVQEATLHLALVESDKAPEGTYTVTAHKMVGTNPDVAGATGYTADGVASWTPNACCYSNAPLAQADISPAYATQAIDKAPGYKAWAITAMVREWLAAPATNFGLFLSPDPSQLMDRYRYFASMEHPDGAIRPFLRITYSLPPSP